MWKPQATSRITVRGVLSLGGDAEAHSAVIDNVHSDRGRGRVGGMLGSAAFGRGRSWNRRDRLLLDVDRPAGDVAAAQKLAMLEGRGSKCRAFSTAAMIWGQAPAWGRAARHVRCSQPISSSRAPRKCRCRMVDDMVRWRLPNCRMAVMPLVVPSEPPNRCRSTGRKASGTTRRVGSAARA